MVGERVIGIFVGVEVAGAEVGQVTVGPSNEQRRPQLSPQLFEHAIDREQKWE